nr:lanthionine synthetase LanC family protein [uncultured Dyadobacter sp.]
MVNPVFDSRPACVRIQKIHDTVDSERGRLDRFGFRNGFLGISVFCYLYSVHTGQSTYLQQSSKYFDIACQTINIDPAVSYCVDFADLGITAQYLIQEGVLDLTPNIFLEDVDRFLANRMRREITENNIAGFSTGAAGYGLYFLHRANYNPQQSTIMLSELFSAIRYSIVRSEYESYSWLSRIDQNPLNELNLSCGVCSIILLMSKMIETGCVTDSYISDISSRLVDYVLLKHEALLDRRKSICFQEGDLGIGYALLRAGLVFNNRAHSEKGKQILEQCADVLLNERQRPIDISMLDGFSGAALVFEKAHQLTCNELYNDATQFCFQAVLEYDLREDIWPLVPPDLSFMKGISGAGAGLIKALIPDKIDFAELLWLI